MVPSDDPPPSPASKNQDEVETRPGAVPQPLTAAWLQQNAALGLGAVAAVEESLLSRGSGSLNGGAISRLTVETADQAAEFVVKRISLVGPSLQAALFQRWYEREYRFFTEVSGQTPSASTTAPRCDTVLAVAGSETTTQGAGLPLQVPRCAAAAWAKVGEVPGTPTFLLVLEPLSPPRWRRPDPAVGCSLEDALNSVEALGRLHCHFYGSESAQLASLGWLPDTPLHIEFASVCQGYFEAAWASSRSSLGEVPEAVCSMCDALCNCYPQLAQRMTQPPLTLLHGDFRLENLCFGTASPEDGTPVVAAFEWQQVCRGRGAYDFACFLALSMPPQERRIHEPQIKQCYLSVLARCNAPVAATEVNSFELDVCAALLLILAAFILGAASAPREALPSHQRAIAWLGQMAIDWNAGRVLDQNSTS